MLVLGLGLVPVPVPVPVLVLVLVLVPVLGPALVRALAWLLVAVQCVRGIPWSV